MTAATPERIYYDAGDGIAVTSSRVVIGGTTYALRNLVSVRMFELPPSRSAEGVLIACGAVVMVYGYGTASSEMRSYRNDASPVGGVIFGLIGLAAVIVGVILLRAKSRPQYAVRISTSSGESDALIHRDRDYVQRIVTAVATAIGEYGAGGPRE